MIDEWLGGKETELRDEGRRLIAIDVESLSSPKLADLIDETFAYVTDAWFWHFRLHGAAVWEIGTLGLELERDHGWNDIEFAALFTGLSNASTAPGEAQDAIVKLIADANGLDALARAKTLDDVREISRAVGDAIDDYLDTWGLRAVRYEVAYPTVAERPEWLLHQLQEHRPHPHDGDRSAPRRRRAKAPRRARRHRRDPGAARGGTSGVPGARGQRAGDGRASARGGATGRPRCRTSPRAQRQPRTARRRVRPPRHRGHRAAALGDAWRRPIPVLRARTRREARAEADARVAPLTIGPRADGSLEAPDLSGFPDDIVNGTNAMVWYTTKIFGAAPSPTSGSPEVTGQPVSPGTYEGTARIVLDERELDRIEAGDVLVCPITSPVWSMVFPALGALVCDSGGALSHPAIIAREFGIPAVVGTGNATTSIPDGSTVRVDGEKGTVTVVAPAA